MGITLDIDKKVGNRTGLPNYLGDFKRRFAAAGNVQAEESEAAREMPTADQATCNKSVRRPLPDHLPRDEKIYSSPSEAAPPAAGAWRPCGGRCKVTRMDARQFPRDPPCASKNWPASERPHVRGNCFDNAPIKCF